MIKKKERIHFVQKDVSLFKYLHAYKVARLDQIERDIFQNVNRKTLYWRLKKLERHHYLTCRYGLNQGNKKVFSITKKTFDQFLQRGDERRMEFASDAIDHDLNLVDIHFMFGKSSKVLEYLTENQLQTWGDYLKDKSMLPMVELRCDAAIKVKLPNGIYWLAIEYEATSKSIGRYKEILQKLYGTIGLTTVLYICGDDAIKNKIVEAESKLYSNERPLIYYQTLKALREHPLNIFINRIGRKIHL
ncbi:MAG: hypothetical protein KAQ98_07615 [Bacteriovoracaceae bacterium]|nr:hypothetical protein [Bacteriovoracaceae bacterium]